MDRGITLTLSLWKYVGRVWTGLMWLKIGYNGLLLETQYELSASIRYGFSSSLDFP
jgi:hypothetical protein